jgi:UDP-glucose 4-epimerase
MVVPSLVERALAGEPLQVFGDGLQTRCFCHVHDTVAALIGLLDEPSTNGEIYNVGNTTPIEIGRLAERIVHLTESPSRIELIQYDEAYGPGFEDMRHRVPDISKIGAAIGWRPERDLDRVLADVIADKRRAAVGIR